MNQLQFNLIKIFCFTIFKKAMKIRFLMRKSREIRSFIFYTFCLICVAILILKTLFSSESNILARRSIKNVKLRESNLGSKHECSCRQNEIVSIKKNGIGNSMEIKLFDGTNLIRNYTTKDSLSLTCHSNKVLRRGPNQKIISYSIFGKSFEYT